MNVFLDIYFPLVAQIQTLQTEILMISRRDTRNYPQTGSVVCFRDGVLMFWERELNVLGEQQREFTIRCGSDLREEVCCWNEQVRDREGGNLEDRDLEPIVGGQFP